MTQYLKEFGANYQVNKYVELFNELDSRLTKFTVKIFLLDMKGLIDIDNPDDVSRIRIML